MSSRRWGPILLALLLGIGIVRQSVAAADVLKARADRVTGRIKDKDAEEVVLEGHVVVRQNETIIESDRAVYNKETESIKFAGAVRLRAEDVLIEAEALLYRRDKEEGVFTGRVRLVREEERDTEGRATKDGFTLTCGELSFAVQNKSFTARDEAALEHEEFSATAGEIVYDDDRQELRLSREPMLYHDDEKIGGETITIQIQEESFQIVKADIVFTVEEEEES